jgi:hypothetical protein
MVEPIPDCPVHRGAVEMIRSPSHPGEPFDKRETLPECHGCTICQLAREFAYLQHEETGGRVSRRRRDSPAVRIELRAEVIRRHGA